MLKKSLRLAIALAAATSAALVSVAGQPASAGASTGTLFAITSSQTLVKVDPTTGAFTLLTDLNSPNFPQSFDLASDPAGHKLYVVRMTVTFDTNGFPIFTQNLLTIDSKTGAILAQPQTSFNAQALVVDASSGDLFAFDGLHILRVNAATGAGTTIATVASSFGPFINSLAIDSASHTIYVSREDVSGPIETNQTAISSVNDLTGSVTTGPVLNRPVRQIALDGGKLFGITDGFSRDLVAIDNTTGATSFVASVPASNGFIQFGMAVDPATHTVYATIDVQDPITFTFSSKLVELNDQTGATAIVAIADSVASSGIAFEAVIPITPESIKADVKAALISGAIDNAGVGTSLLAELNAAADARAGATASGARSNGCATAAAIYEAFINELNAQSGQHVAAATASQLISEAQFLIANCP